MTRVELSLFAPGATLAIPLGAAEVVVGRDEGCAARVDDPSVSRRHAALRLERDRIVVRDLGSANGTFVRERATGDGAATARMRPVRDELAVAAGAVLQFGAIVALVAAVREPAAATPVVVDPAMRALYDRLARIASAPINVLILGETGVGKEIVARAIHDRSPRAGGRFLGLNCAALSPTLIEAELFGHEKGAFTGATQAKEGLFEAARGGTVFLDEIGELPLAAQAKLLRVLEERAVLPIGSRSPRPIDVRFVAATHVALEAACDAGAFRRDLFYRLEGASLTIPPLRARVAEIGELARAFLARAGRAAGASPATFSAEATLALERYAWPGNVRELKNAVELAAVLAPGDVVGVEHLPERVRTARIAPTIGDERARILAALAETDHNQSRAAEILGISRRTLVSRLGEYGMTKPRKPRS